ncbi:retrovirus-related pol polyprotein from transposon TNT 1-94 [Tanacetum coccineum]
MIGHRDKLINFVSMFIGTVRFGNNHFAAIMGYGDSQMGNILILRVYYVEGLGHNLFSVGQFCDSDLEVAFSKHTCFVRNLEGVNLKLTDPRVRYLRTDNGTEFLNQTLRNYTKEVGITHHTSTARTPQQDSVVERRNRTLVEGAASTSSKPPTKNDWDLLFQPMYNEYFKSPSALSTPISSATLLPPDTAGASYYSTSIDKDAPSPSTSPNIKATNSPINSTNPKEEPNNYKEAMIESSWIEAMQDEIHEFERLEEEGIDFEEFFALVARIKAIRIFLAYAAHMNMVVF